MNRISCFIKKFYGINARRHFLITLICGLILTTISCSSSDHISENDVQRKGDQKNPGEVERLEELYWTRVDSAKMQFTQADVDFMVGMIAHHAQALIMSDLAPKNNASPTIQTLAARIINAQKDEIETMQRWLRDRNQPVPIVQIDELILNIEMDYPDNHSDDHEMMGHSHTHHRGMDHSGMPGMLSQDQLNELSELRGDAFDRTFLKYMIEHHEGAVIMVKNLFDTDGAALDQQAFRLASDIQADQLTEIARMQLMLDNMIAP